MKEMIEFETLKNTINGIKNEFTPKKYIDSVDKRVANVEKALEVLDIVKPYLEQLKDEMPSNHWKKVRGWLEQ